MDDYHSNEPLNLVKKKKPVAVVAPSSVNDDKYSHTDKSDSVDKAETEDGGKCGTAERSPSPKNGYPAFLGAPYDPNFLTNLYMNSLMTTAGYLNNNYAAAAAYPYAYNGFGTAASSPAQLNGNLSNLWAQQRFWQMVNWHEAQRKAEQAKAADETASMKGDANVPLGEPLKVAIPSFSNNSDRSEAKESPKKGLKRKKHPQSRYGVFFFIRHSGSHMGHEGIEY